MPQLGCRCGCPDLRPAMCEPPESPNPARAMGGFQRQGRASFRQRLPYPRIISRELALSTNLTVCNADAVNIGEQHRPICFKAKRHAARYSVTDADVGGVRHVELLPSLDRP